MPRAMKYVIPPALLALLLGFQIAGPAAAHCEVPCGIYGDQARFESMLEDTTTVTKAMAQINELAGKTDAQSVNQLARWVANKESHATKIQNTIGQYFMAQRIKADKPNYVAQLTSAHAVIVKAMKCKQTVDAKNAAALKQAILDFHAAYAGKKPSGHGHEHK